MEVPRLVAESELQLLAYATAIAMRDLSCLCALHHSLWQNWILSPLSEGWGLNPHPHGLCCVLNLLNHSGNSLIVYFEAFLLPGSFLSSLGGPLVPQPSVHIGHHFEAP